MRSVRIALAAGLAILAAAVVAVMAHAPMTVAATNRVQGQAEQPIAETAHGASYCQAREVLPRGSTAIRIWIDASYGPRVSVSVSARGRRLTGGERGSGWSGGSVTVPLRPLARTISGVSVCVSFRLRDETVIVQGSATPASAATRVDGRALAGHMWIEYLRPGARSWASLASATARRLGFGHAAAGIWVALLALGLLASVVVLASSLLLRELV
jgi:hypothetical protein